ncbi:hypothetical protein EV421DRAFT_2037876 [Armillaria borealis]|uniref:Uncharacterized protein n=1 Tax=Armillaria borealis TaxID=47425 RepID=A0AA39ML23_9AGAR|nr:hypothetical protein EV421DRAFT_2037876 [Armillaria borealis]
MSAPSIGLSSTSSAKRGLDPVQDMLCCTFGLENSKPLTDDVDRVQTTGSLSTRETRVLGKKGARPRRKSIPVVNNDNNYGLQVLIYNRYPFATDDERPRSDAKVAIEKMPTFPSTLSLADVFATRLTTRWRLHHDHQPVEEETEIAWFDAQRTECRPIRGHGFRFSVDGDQLIHPNLLCLEEHWNYSFPVLLQAKEVGVQNPLPPRVDNTHSRLVL